MRHLKKRHNLGRTASHRKATLAALSNALISHKRITTTLAKAKALRVYVEPLINRAKDDSTHSRRQVFRHLQSKESLKELFGDVADRIGDRAGGYTRVVKLGRRAGDGAPMAMIELVDYNDVQPEGGAGTRRRTRRGGGRGSRRRGGKAEGAAAPQPATKPDSKVTTEVAHTEQVGEEGVETEAVGKARTIVEKPIDEAQAKTVQERTAEEDVEAVEHVDEAKKIIEEQKTARAEEETAEQVDEADEVAEEQTKARAAGETAEPVDEAGEIAEEQTKARAAGETAEPVDDVDEVAEEQKRSGTEAPSGQAPSDEAPSDEAGGEARSEEEEK